MTAPRTPTDPHGAAYAVPVPGPWWALKVASGMRIGDLIGLFRGNWHRIAARRYPLVALLFALGPLNSGLSALGRLLVGRAIARSEPVLPPVVIIGHHRTGTTRLHELLALHPALQAPTGFDCFAAPHSFIGRKRVVRLLDRLVQKRRPMDGMAHDLFHPQEEEFALLALGAPTPYRRILFPSADAGGVDWYAADQRPLEEAYAWFVKAMTWRYRRRLLLKSPLDTGRVAWLRRRFPGIRFVHVVRAPDAIIRSSHHLWHALELDHGLERVDPVSPSRAAFVAATFDWMYGNFWRDEADIPEGELITVRYEDLAARPRDVLDAICAAFGLGGFAANAGLLEGYLASTADYRPNRFPAGPPPGPEPALLRRYAERYGYDLSGP